MADIGLLPCPFCGGDAQIQEQHSIFGDLRYLVWCPGCGVRFPLKMSVELAAEAWNRRRSTAHANSIPLEGD